MKKINPSLSQIIRTEPKDWKTEKVLSLTALLDAGETSFLREPLYLVRHPYRPSSYFIYDGNTRHFLAEQGLISLENFYLLETDDDLQEVRSRMQEIYWPGADLGEVVSYLSSWASARQVREAPAQEVPEEAAA